MDNTPFCLSVHQLVDIVFFLNFPTIMNNSASTYLWSSLWADMDFHFLGGYLGVESLGKW